MTALTEFYFTKKELAQVHPLHLAYLIAGAHACNELNAIRVYLIFERNDFAERSAEKPFITIRQMVLLRHLAAKLFEFNRVTISYFAKIKKAFPDRAKSLQTQYLPIANRIRKFKRLDVLRNKMAFHFDDQRFLDQFQDIANHQEMSFMVGDRQGETAFLFAEEIVSMPYFSEIGQGDMRKGLENMAQFANRATSEVLSFYTKFHLGISKQYGLLRKRRRYEPNRHSIGEYGRDFIPVFTSKDLNLRTRNISGDLIDE
jgi:hypothetical protein